MGLVPPFPKMSAETVRDAQPRLALTDDQLAPLLGFEKEHRLNQLAKIKDGTKAPSVPVARLVTAYLDGYRPDDWPESGEDGVPPFPVPAGPALHDARLALELTRGQFAALLGFEGKGASDQLDDMMRGKKPIMPHTARLVAAYLDGYRPAGWPGV